MKRQNGSKVKGGKVGRLRFALIVGLVGLVGQVGLAQDIIPALPVEPIPAPRAEAVVSRSEQAAQELAAQRAKAVANVRRELASAQSAAQKAQTQRDKALRALQETERQNALLGSAAAQSKEELGKLGGQLEKLDAYAREQWQRAEDTGAALKKAESKLRWSWLGTLKRSAIFVLAALGIGFVAGWMIFATVPRRADRSDGSDSSDAAERTGYTGGYSIDGEPRRAAGVKESLTTESSPSATTTADNPPAAKAQPRKARAKRKAASAK